MTDKKLPSLLGGAMIIAGTAIGAGILANPTSTAGIWFVGSVGVLIYTWFCMTTSGLMLLEANLHYPTGASFDTIVTDLLGKRWNIVNGLSVAFVLYILTYAYITSGGSITENAINSLGIIEISRSMGSLVFCLVLAIFVWFSTKTVDRLSTILIGGMIISFFLSTTGLLTSVNGATLLDNQDANAPAHLPYLLTALPVCLVSFGFHGNVPSLVKYYNRDGQKVMHFIYILWQMAVQGNLPRKEFAPVIAKGGDIAALLDALSSYININYIEIALNFFAYMAIASSFLGVTLGLFDYIADLLKFSDTPWGRAKTALVTFAPPLLLSLQFPYGFVAAIGYAGLAATLWAAIVPALLVRASRKKFPHTTYKVYGGNGMIYFIIIFGLLNIFTQIGIQLGWIATFRGE